MSKIMQVLEQLGQDANLQSQESIENYLTIIELEKELTTALVNKDVSSLERSLDVCPDIVCIIATPEDDEFEIKQNETKAVSNG
ncbi:MAG: hypothetical protein HRT52_16390 [Colwellia sp.]|nr:hypothetical protein [Colwellia sp.]